jgi:hypothetical protein
MKERWSKLFQLADVVSNLINRERQLSIYAGLTRVSTLQSRSFILEVFVKTFVSIA